VITKAQATRGPSRKCFVANVGACVECRTPPRNRPVGLVNARECLRCEEQLASDLGAVDLLGLPVPLDAHPIMPEEIA
jgi:hypothetical protein